MKTQQRFSRDFRNSTLRGSSSSSSMSNLFDQQRSSSHSGAAPPPPPPPPPPTSPLSSYQHSEMQPLAPTPDRRAESNVQNKVWRSSRSVWWIDQRSDIAVRCDSDCLQFAPHTVTTVLLQSFQRHFFNRPPVLHLRKSSH